MVEKTDKEEEMDKEREKRYKNAGNVQIKLQ